MDNRNFGMNIFVYSHKKKIKALRQWNTCSFCGRQMEVRPHSPIGWEWITWKIFPLRLCIDCADLQKSKICEVIRKKKEGEK